MNKSGRGGYVQAQAKGRRTSAQASALSAPRRFVNARTLTPAQIKDHLTPAHVEALCRDWLPHGKRQGGWWVCTSPWRQDKTPSLAVSLTTKRWQDFGSGESGDIFDLSMRLFGDTFSDTLDGFAEMLGMKNA